MERKELLDYLDGFMAWDNGCIDSGIKDDIRRKKISIEVLNMTENEFKYLMFDFVALYDAGDGFSAEDWKMATEWLNEFRLEEKYI